jgi:hypothetical protein
MKSISSWLINTAIRFIIEHEEKLELVDLDQLYKAEHAIINVVEDKIYKNRVDQREEEIKKSQSDLK